MPADLVLAATTGLLGGFGHCAGMCGPLVASVGLVSAPGGARRALAGQALYNAGRVTTYACIGALMGLTGSFVNVAGRMAGLQEVVAVAAGALMVLMGLGAAGLLAFARRAEERVAGKVFRAVRGVLEGGGIGRYYALGLVLGFLPCGLSYSAFVGAAATGSLPGGLLFALAFALGTVPALLLVGGLASALSPRLRGALYRAGGVAVALVGLLFVLRGLGVHAPL
ncbi:MAG TPA: sulfite exporter TauE/SafE family protein [Anaeromyxobacteraceae bacterium]|nr:sulfite exporter TauE/SafE family protein [Anaeromyxobacteraceae bacterium]